jgi:hypothetical protein
MFRRIDDDGSGEIDCEELFNAFKAMKLNVNFSQNEAIFGSIDFDGSGKISLNELDADFNNVIAKDIHELWRDNNERNETIERNTDVNEDRLADTLGANSFIDPNRLKEIQMEQRNAKLKCQVDRLEKQLQRTYKQLQNAENNCRELTIENT